ncbi:DUF1563 domain-containing protein [uncultured Microscilla sp.]|uniref:DUF1563 domain-containing protein n=1 Tax=uncultured Microscilla sp. TaxID=432653 RepID=UPI003453E981
MLRRYAFFVKIFLKNAVLDFIQKLFKANELFVKLIVYIVIIEFVKVFFGKVMCHHDKQAIILYLVIQ